MHIVGEPLGHLETTSFDMFSFELLLVHSSSFLQVSSFRITCIAEVFIEISSKNRWGWIGFITQLSFSSKNLQFGMFVFSLQPKKTFMYMYYESHERNRPPLASSKSNSTLEAQGLKLLSCCQHDVINGVNILGASLGITGRYPDLTAFSN